ncbi:MAG: FMN-binding glutamate synthase family protein [Acetobacteraceae bacterium]|nr:FMN-binding glutamate synthase family protein [Acetobacteraceae bacterium]
MPRSAVWTPDVIKEIREKSKTGKYINRGFGANRPLPSLDDLMVVPAQLYGPAAVDRYREEVKTRVVIGERLLKPLVLETPVFIPAMSFGAISKAGKMAFALGAAKAGTATNTGEGGALPEEREVTRSEGQGKLIVQWSTGRFGVDVDYLRMADAIEIKIGQGAKPGMGGHLLAEKVSPAIAEIRKIPVGTDALSPCRHLDTDSPEDLRLHVELLREATDYQIPIILKLGPGRVYEDVKLAVECGVDAVAIDGGEGGTGCAPEVASEHAGIPTLGLFGPAMRAFKETRARERGIKLMVMGGIRNGADVYKCLALGADAVGMATATMIAAGCIGCQECHTGTCKQGLATQAADAAMDWRDAGQKLANFLKVTTEELKTLVALSGHDNIDQLSPDDLVALDINAAAMTGVKLIGYDRPLPWWRE